MQAKRIKVQWIPTSEMIADGFTKVLPTQKHANFVRLLNLVDIKDKIKIQDPSEDRKTDPRRVC